MRIDIGRYSRILSGSKSNWDEFEPPSINCHRCSDTQSILYWAGAFPVFRTEIEKKLELPGFADNPLLPAVTTWT